jgi:hypothetical protein
MGDWKCVGEDSAFSRNAEIAKNKSKCIMTIGKFLQQFRSEMDACHVWIKTKISSAKDLWSNTWILVRLGQGQYIVLVPKWCLGFRRKVVVRPNAVRPKCPKTKRH